MVTDSPASAYWKSVEIFLMDTRETRRLTVTGTVPPSLSSCLVDPLITNASVLLSPSWLTLALSSASVVTSLRVGAFTRAQTVRSPDVAVSWAVIAAPASW